MEFFKIKTLNVDVEFILLGRLETLVQSMLLKLLDKFWGKHCIGLLFL